jgi:pentapeptide MXKDX repeat protein
MMGTSAIRNLIREDKVAQMYSVIQTSAESGMQTLDQALTGLVAQGLASHEEATKIAFYPKTMSQPATSQPATSQPAMSQPAMSKPEMSKPEMSKPEMSKPEMSKPEMSKPEMSKPAMSRQKKSQEEHFLNNQWILPLGQ